ncbi:MAG TPA: excinuclease ABC subunit B, partial [Haliea salexigens]|nr:excinuclease ABC subunit B [Haliea salexigens]
LDADKEGFLRSDRSLIQTIGRAARNLKGRAVLYADKVTGSMERAMAETARRREKQLAHNAEHGITPVGVTKSVKDIMEGARRMPTRGRAKGNKVAEQALAFSADIARLSPAALARKLQQMEAQMQEHARNLEFEQAAALRDQLAEARQLAFIS